MIFYQRFLRYALFILVLVNLIGFVCASTKISTDLPGVFAYAHTRGYYYQIKPHDFPVIHEDPAPYIHGGSFAQGAPLTVYNNWPKRVSNASIFPYLAKHHFINPSRYSEFCTFVNNWYQSSCAVVYSSSTGSEIIGSGALVGDSFISTARHNFEHIPNNHLFTRFFRYSIFSTKHEGVLWIQEDCLDVPVISTYRAISGLDAGYLSIPLLDSKIFRRYARVLPSQTGAIDGFLAAGEYGMFHFAGGIHQVSVGEVNQCMWGAWLHNDIAIQGGPGSSGAAVIGKWFDHIQGCGVSIYRQIHQDWGTSVERRLISFAHFANPGATLDCISAPYLYDSNFYVSSSAHLSESGYEFLRWSLAYAGHGNDHPGLKMFEVQENHSNHHIIPRGDLLYLWDYVYDVPTYQPVTDRLKEAIRLQVIAESLNAKRRKTPFNSQERANFLYNEQLKVYGQLRQHLNELCVTYYDRYGRYQSVNGPIGFYWAEWNLFKGWNSHHRSDDPVRDGEDRSEKNKPHGFNKGLWECLKNPKTGLYHGIQSLKQSTLSGVPNISLLSQLDESVVKIIELWIRLPKHHKIIHPFNPDEWESQKGLYRVR